MKNKQINDTRHSFRHWLDEVMKEDKLDDMDLEDVESSIYYSRGVRTLCVLDPRFEEQIDMIQKEFAEETKEKSLIMRQTYDTLYGSVAAMQREKNIVIALSDNDSEKNNRKDGRH